MNWRYQGFLWFDEMLDLLGETLATGKYSFQGLQDEEDIAEALEEDETQTIDLALNQLDAEFQTPRLSTANSIIEDIETDTLTQDRHSLSAGIRREKKKKSSGLSVIAGMNNGIIALAEAIRFDSSQGLKDTVDSTIQGQALQKVQEEAFLTEDVKG
jgi:hypothetical protein